MPVPGKPHISVNDGLQSLATRMGTSQDKIATATYAHSYLTDAQIDAAYETSWIAEQLVDTPSFDATRKWREWSGDGAEDVEALEKALGLQSRTQTAHMESRKLGGGCILIGIPGDPDWSEPINLDRIRRGSLEYLVEFGRDELTAGEIELDPRKPEFRYPKWYDIHTGTGELLRVHPTRLAKFRGKRSRRLTLNGWGRSVLQSTWEACRNLDATTRNIASLVFDARTDVIKIPGLSEKVMLPELEEQLVKRFATARMMKGNHGTLILDGGGGNEGDAGEEYIPTSYAFGGLDTILDRFMTIASGAADIPMVRLFGMSAAGMNATGEIDLANYHENIAAQQSIQIGPALNILDECMIRSALGRRPDDLKAEWRPLRQMTETQIAEIRAKNADTIAKLAATQVYPDAEIAEAGAQMMRESGVDALTGEVPTLRDDPEGMGV